ncbi:PRC-barrel domain-containing protein [Jannaschia ovalis]|uniref:PRC-barrel domain-containing protein n=1 Tax=Jannaschia ovalis TaxID=3038773 RepID=A0ABY8LF93_9RHOB|nr:PRC-barrel domain-containing protein [Jannaschia sp. GRR-S6-38]WGH79977.1 PRC-barrel domain-containing protein [Jannaschia sp. GRR-S6-38]
MTRLLVLIAGLAAAPAAAQDGLAAEIAATDGSGVPQVVPLSGNTAASPPRTDPPAPRIVTVSPRPARAVPRNGEGTDDRDGPDEIALASLLGLPVEDAAGTRIGTLQDIIADPETGRLGAVLIEGAGEDGPRRVPFMALHFSPREGRAVLTRDGGDD